MDHNSDIETSIIFSLFTPKGSYWVDPSLGSNLHRLKNAPMSDESLALAKEYEAQALSWIRKDMDIETHFEEPRSLTLMNKRLEYDCKKLFDILVKGYSQEKWSSLVREYRTFFIQNPYLNAAHYGALLVA